MRSVQICTSFNAQGVRGLLKLLLTGFLFIRSITFIFRGFLLSTSGGLSLVPKGFAGAIYITTSALTARNILTLLLITLLILCFLSLDKLLNLITLLKVVALGPINLAIWPIAFPGLVDSRSLPAVSACVSFLAGGFGSSLLAGTRCARSFDGHHCLILAPLVALLSFLLTGGFIVIL